MTFWKTLGQLVASCMLLPAFLLGQAADGNLVGSIFDRSGAALAGATVTLENIETGIKYSTTANPEGVYRFNNVPAGHYSFTAAQPGFTTATAQNLRIEANRTTTFNSTLEVGSVTTTVEVQEAAVLIDTTTANITNTYNTRAAQSMPLTGFGTGSTNLGVINLSLLSSGVSSSGGVGYGTGPSIGGQRPTNNNFMIEGVDNNNRSVTGPSSNVPNEAVAEFSLQQNQFSAEFGHSSGGQFNTILKSGGNQIHGSVYEYNQNKLLAAVDEAFARQGIRQTPRYDNNRLGASVGGPVLRNKWFYFGNVEYNPLG